MWRKISRLVWRTALTTLLLLIPGAFFVVVGAMEGACIQVGAGLICAAWLADAVELGVLPVIALAILIVLVHHWQRSRSGPSAAGRDSDQGAKGPKSLRNP